MKKSTRNFLVVFVVLIVLLLAVGLVPRLLDKRKVGVIKSISQEEKKELEDWDKEGRKALADKVKRSKQRPISNFAFASSGTWKIKSSDVALMDTTEAFFDYELFKLHVIAMLPKDTNVEVIGKSGVSWKLCRTPYGKGWIQAQDVKAQRLR